MQVYLKWMALATTVLVCGVLKANPNKALIFCSEGSPEGFDPARYLTGTTFDASSETVFNRLVQFENGGVRVEPGLAQKWDISPDGLTYTFYLRPNVSFHTTKYFKPTRPFNAEDVVFTFQRMLDKQHPFQKAYPVRFDYAASMNMPANILAVEAVAPLTVRIRLKQRDVAFLVNMAMPFISIHSAEYANQLLKSGRAADLNVFPIGTGPFVFNRYDKDSQIRYAAFDKYWRGRQKIDTLIFAITKDSAVRMQKLRANACQVSAFPKPSEVEVMKTDKNLKVLSESGLNISYLALNTKRKPFDQVAVRRALDMAIDKKTIINAVYRGAAVPAVTPIPPTMWSYNKQVKATPYDIAAAKALLKSAGYPNGFKTKIWAIPVQRAYNPNGNQMAELVQADLAKIGVKAEIVKYEWGEYIKRAQSGESEIGMFGWVGDNGDPDNFLYTLLSCDAIGSSNYSQWCDKEFNALLDQARSTEDAAQRTKLYEKAQVIFKEKLPWITIAHATVYQPMRKDVLGLKISPFGLTSFDGVSMQDKVGANR